jgi:hypothetical protein
MNFIESQLNCHVYFLHVCILYTLNIKSDTKIMLSNGVLMWFEQL